MSDLTQEVRRTARTDRGRAAAVLADAFADDPVLSFLLPPTIRARRRRLQALFALEEPRSRRCGGAWTATDGSAAALWYPPGRWREPLWSTAFHGPASTAVFGRRTALATRVLATMVDHHPREPHWYLLYLGTAAAAQGTGRGSTLLRAVLDQCDTQGLPAYLEATNERNRALYRRHGFRDRDRLPLPAGGPPLYPMWRDAR
ncbi:MAG TPA: GNAT family N-acetyltransferase [Jatrophihabitans sp.]|jgi:GNAT superfamily N-acetyltransferase